MPADIVQPEITDEEVDLVVENFAEPAISASVKVKAGGADAQGHAEDDRRRDHLHPQNGTLAPVLDADKLRRNAEAAVKTVELTRARNATVRLVNGKPKVIPAVNRTAISAENLKKAVEPALTKSGGGRTVTSSSPGPRPSSPPRTPRSSGSSG